MQLQQNNGKLSGKLKNNWVFDYERNGETFYKGTLLVDRLSGVADEIPLSISDKILDQYYTLPTVLAVSGQFRSRNQVVDGKSTLQLYFFVDEILEDSLPGINSNNLILEGYICKIPNYRLTPLGKQITDLIVAVNRGYNKSDYIPCIAWGRNAKWLESQKVGTLVRIEGRIQSRKFSKPEDTEPDTRTAYEVSISKISKIDQV